MSHFESSLTGIRDRKLHFQVYTPKESKGLLLVTHGQAEHSGCYKRLVDGLKELSLTLFLWDLPGHGRSQGQRGFIEDFADYAHDLELVQKHATRQFLKSGQPFFMLGHSMGGLIQLQMLMTSKPSELTAQVLSAPFFGVALPVPAWKEMAARYVRDYLPRLTLSNEIRFEQLTSEEAIIQEYKKDVLRGTKISAEAYLGSMKASSFVLERASKIDVPSLFQIPSYDPVVDTSMSLGFARSLKAPTTIIEYEDSRHEIYNDIEREKAFQDLRSFLAKFIKN